MKRWILLVLCGLPLLLTRFVASAAMPMCADPTNPACNGGATLTADQARGEFHGLIMVEGQPGVLDTAAHSGTEPGCGDCEWTLVISCFFDNGNSASNNSA